MARRLRPVASTDTLLACERHAEAERLLVILDLSGRGGVLTVPPGTIIFATDAPAPGPTVEGALTILPNQGVIIRLVV